MKEDTLLRKLIADGEGIGDDRRLQQVAAFFRESRKAEEPKIAEALKATKALEHLETNVIKQKIISEMNQKQSEDFEKLANDIDKQIELTYKKMETAKTELIEAKNVKKNRQEYRKLVKVIDEVPSRSETNRKLSEIKDELERQHERQKVLEAKLTNRRNQLQAFNIILCNFQRFIKEDDDDDEVNSEVTGNAEDDDEVASVPEEK